MESITIKVNDEMAAEIEKAMKPNYTTKTELIREAVRDKVKQIENDRFLSALQRFKGSATVHVSDERLHEIREEVMREMIKKRGIKLD